MTPTVKPVSSDHPTVLEKVVVIDRSSQGSPKYDFPKLSWKVTNAMVHMSTVCTTASHVDLVQVVASRGGSHSQTCAPFAVLTKNVGSKQQFFLLLVAWERENLIFRAKNAGRVT